MSELYSDFGISSQNHYKLQEVTKRIFDINSAPVFTCAFPLILSNGGRTFPLEFCLGSDNDSHRTLILAKAINDSLEGVDGEKFWWKTSLIVLDNTNKPYSNGRQSFIHSTVSVNPHHLEYYSDDAMYEVDDLGMKVLKAGVNKNYFPVWAWSNYNFMQLELGRLNDLDGRGVFLSGKSASDSYLKPVIDKLLEERKSNESLVSR